MATTQELMAKLSLLAAPTEDTFLEVAAALRRIQEQDPEAFQSAIKASDIGPRKAYYLISIDEAFKKLGVSKTRMKKIGWTKLQLIAPHIDKANSKDLLKKAEEYSVKDLEKVLRGEDIKARSKAVLFYLDPTDYEDVAKALVKHGAAFHGRGLANKDEALVRLARKVLDS